MIMWTKLAPVLIATLPGAALAIAAGAPGLAPATIAEHQTRCAGRDGWSDPAPPIRIFANVYDIGTCGITVLLIVGDRGSIVIDGATTQAPPSILANLRRLGLRPADVKLLLSSHEHQDHAGGLGALRRATGARMVARAAARPVLESGVTARSDPQREGDRPAYPGVPVDRIVRDGEAVVLGSLRLTALATPGHSPGGTSWTWRSCAGTTCRTIVYADSISAVSTDGYRFRDHLPYVATLRHSIDRIARLPCDLLITPHPQASDLYPRLAGKKPLTDRRGCMRYAADGRTALERRLAREDQGEQR